MVIFLLNVWMSVSFTSPGIWTEIPGQSKAENVVLPLPLPPPRPGSGWRFSFQAISICNCNHCWHEGLLAWDGCLSLTEDFSKTWRLQKVLQGASRPMHFRAWDPQAKTQSFLWMCQTVLRNLVHLVENLWPFFKIPQILCLGRNFYIGFILFYWAKKSQKSKREETGKSTSTAVSTCHSTRHFLA